MPCVVTCCPHPVRGCLLKDREGPVHVEQLPPAWTPRSLICPLMCPHWDAKTGAHRHAQGGTDVFNNRAGPKRKQSNLMLGHVK